MKRTKILLAVAVATMALSAVGASSASATIYNANFSTTSFKLSTTGVTIKRNGAEAKTCTASINMSNLGSGNFIGSNESSGRTLFLCDGGASGLYMRMVGRAKYDSVAEKYYLEIYSYNESMQSPWSWYFQYSQKWTWVNGSGTTPSTVTLNEQLIGYTTTGQPITMSGTFTAKTSTGGLVTLSH